jgi:hypothetical protein
MTVDLWSFQYLTGAIDYTEGLEDLSSLLEILMPH